MALSFSSTLGIVFSDGTAQNSIPNTFGLTQTWSTQTYATGSTYTNSTSLPILVNFRCPMPDGSSYTFYVGSATVCQISDANYGNEQSVLIFIPANSTFSYNAGGTGSTSITGYRLQ